MSVSMTLEEQKQILIDAYINLMRIKKVQKEVEYSSAAKPPVRCGGSHLSGLTEPLVLHCHAWV